MKSLRIVSPVYRAESCIQELYNRLTQVLGNTTNDYEIILVNDCSPDHSWDLISGICAQDSRVKGVNLSRNFGQHNAIIAGLAQVTKEWVVVMDCDLQDVPEEIPKLLNLATTEVDIVLARRFERQDTFFKILASKTFFAVMGYLTGQKQDATVANFGVYHKKVINAVLMSGDKAKSFPSIVKWVGFRVVKVDVKHAPRFSGKSSYNLSRMLMLALDMILAYSDKPLKLVVKIGVLISLISFLFVFYIIVRAALGGYSVLGYASLMASLWLISGMTLFAVGVVGLYLGKTFEQTKNRPDYIIRDRLN